MSAKICVVCGEEANGEYIHNDKKPFPVCGDCYFSGKLEKWIDESVQIINRSGIAFMESEVQTKTLPELRQCVELYQKQSARLDDGICPNGCAVMVPDPDGDGVHHAICPKCNFGYFSNVGVNFLRE